MVKKYQVAVGMMTALLSTSVFAGNPLLDTLVEKNILTGAEAADLSAQMPSPLVWKGDIRLRYQIDKTDSQAASQERARFRLRLGTEAKINEDTKAYFAFASGSSDARSNNQTYGPGESFYSIGIIQAYVKHNFDDNNIVLAGKMTKPFWAPSNMVWDNDINPDGLAYQWKGQAPFTEYFVNAAYFLIGDSSGTSIRTKAGLIGPSLSLIQPGVSYTIDKNTSAKVALSYYQTNNLVGATAANITNSKDTVFAGGNTVSSTLASATIVYDYNPVILSGELKYKSFFGFDFASIYGEWAKNTAVGYNDQAGVLGVNFGTEKVKKPGEWQAQVSYRYIQKDSVLDIFPDSDYYSGNTGIQGFRTGLQYGVANNTSVTASWFLFEKLSNGVGDAQNLAQLDVQVDF